MHLTTKILPLELVLSRAPPHLELAKEKKLEDKTSNRDFHIIWLSSLRRLMATAKHEMLAIRIRHKLNFDARMKLPLKNFRVDSLVFIKKDYITTNEQNHKLEQIENGPCKVTEVD